MAHWTQQIAEAYRALQEAELLKELNVSSAFKQGGIRGAVNALKGNIKNRGLLSTAVGAIGGVALAKKIKSGIGKRIKTVKIPKPPTTEQINNKINNTIPKI